jgi:chromosome segregation ATPase
VAERERVLALLRELELADGDLAGTLGELDDLAQEIELIRLRALDVIAFHERLPTVRARAVAQLEASDAEVAAARSGLAEAERALEEAPKESEREAQRSHVRARDRLAVAGRRRAEAEADLAQLEREGDGAEEEAGALEARARSLAERLHGRPRLAEAAGVPPQAGLPAVVEWAEGARAALFVARGQLAAERDALIRQANELGTAALGEPLGAASAAVVTRRVEGTTG